MKFQIDYDYKKQDGFKGIILDCLNQFQNSLGSFLEIKLNGLGRTIEIYMPSKNAATQFNSSIGINIYSEWEEVDDICLRLPKNFTNDTVAEVICLNTIFS